MSRMAISFEDKKTGVYYFRMAVSKNLISVFNKRNSKTYLKTKSLAEAKRYFIEHLATTQSDIELARQRTSNSSTISLTARVVVKSLRPRKEEQPQ